MQNNCTFGESNSGIHNCFGYGISVDGCPQRYHCAKEATLDHFSSEKRQNCQSLSTTKMLPSRFSPLILEKSETFEALCLPVTSKPPKTVES